MKVHIKTILKMKSLEHLFSAKKSYLLLCVYSLTSSVYIGQYLSDMGILSRSMVNVPGLIKFIK
jgi:hypothetical protein